MAPGIPGFAKEVSMNSWLTWGYWYMFLLLKELSPPDGLPARTHPLGRGVFNETPSQFQKYPTSVRPPFRHLRGHSHIRTQFRCHQLKKKTTDTEYKIQKKNTRNIITGEHWWVPVCYPQIGYTIVSIVLKIDSARPIEITLIMWRGKCLVG